MKVSVIVPVYNVEKYLERCLDSIIQQSYKDLEIIVVNDGSTDNSGLICDRYAAKDKRVQVIHQNNAGVSVARNTGIKSATGEYIAFVDSDDWLDTNMYQSMVAVVKENPSVDLVMCDYKQIFENEQREIIQEIDLGYYSKPKIISDLYPVLFVAEDFGKIPIVSVWNCLIKLAVLVNHEIRFDSELKYSEDYLFMAALVTKLNSFYYHKGYCFYNYRQLNESRSKKYQSDWWQVQMELNRKLKKLLINHPGFDFSRQLQLQVIYSGLFLLKGIMADEELSQAKKYKEISHLLNQSELMNAFRSVDLKRRPKTLKINLFLMKKRMSLGLLIFRNIKS